MIAVNVIKAVIGALVAGGLIFTAHASRDRTVPAAHPTQPSQILAPSRAVRDMDSLGASVVSGNAFRAHRGPADVRFGAAMEQVETPTTIAQPVLSLTGIVWGGVPAAVVEGLPGVAGARVVAVGETHGGLVVESIVRDTVRISSRDTTWTLTLKRGWQ